MLRSVVAGSSRVKKASCMRLVLGTTREPVRDSRRASGRAPALPPNQVPPLLLPGASKSARSPIALRDFKQIQQCLSADALQPIKKIDFATHALKREPPWISRLCRGSFRRFFS